MYILSRICNTYYFNSNSKICNNISCLVPNSWWHFFPSLLQLCIFFLPATGVIPLHNHPGMTVFSKLLLGKMHIKSYDWVDPTDSDDPAQPCKSEHSEVSYYKIWNCWEVFWLLGRWPWSDDEFFFSFLFFFAGRLAKLKADTVFTSPCSTSVLYPTSGGNIHSFTAITPCAVLDVIGPPYSMEDGRDCSYYKEHPYASFPSKFHITFLI